MGNVKAKMQAYFLSCITKAITYRYSILPLSILIGADSADQTKASGIKLHIFMSKSSTHKTDIVQSEFFCAKE